MREIEVKASVKNKKALIDAAKKLGIHFGGPVHQEDTIYECELPKTDSAWNIFRIRRQDGKSILTMKYKASTRSRDNHERETLIEDAEQVADMLERVGYARGVRVTKKRCTAKYQGLEICLDEVKELGADLSKSRNLPMKAAMSMRFRQNSGIY